MNLHKLPCEIAIEDDNGIIVVPIPLDYKCIECSNDAVYVKGDLDQYSFKIYLCEEHKNR